MQLLAYLGKSIVDNGWVLPNNGIRNRKRATKNESR